MKFNVLLLISIKLLTLNVLICNLVSNNINYYNNIHTNNIINKELNKKTNIRLLSEEEMTQSEIEQQKKEEKEKLIEREKEKVEFAKKRKELVKEGYMNSDTEQCRTNFQCESFCCVYDGCAILDYCKMQSNRIYIGVGITAFVFLIGSIIYLIIRLKWLAKDMKKKAKELNKENLKNEMNDVNDNKIIDK